MTSDFRALVETLAQHRVEYVLIGGVALVLHGSAWRNDSEKFLASQVCPAGWLLDGR